MGKRLTPLISCVLLLFVFLTSAPAVLTEKPLIWYKFEEASGTTAASSGKWPSSFIGSLKGGMQLGTNSVPGHSGNGLNFDGGNDCISIGTIDSDPQTYTRNNVTLTAWIKMNGWVGYQADYAAIIFRFNAPSYAGLNLTLPQHETLGYYWYNGSTVQWDSSNLVVPSDEWVFVGLVIEPAKATLYLCDGLNLSFESHIANHNPVLIPSWIGTCPDSSNTMGFARYFKGAIDDVRIFDYNLPFSKVRRLVDLESYPILPKPVDHANNEQTNVVLRWSPAINIRATAGHDVYFGTNQAYVDVATVSNPLGVYKGRQDGNSFAPGQLQYNHIYYWRIDEISTTGVITKGVVWQFKTTAYITWESFESYTTKAQLWAKWLDSSHGGTPNTGSTIVLPTPSGFELVPIIYQGKQGMDFNFDNTGSGGKLYYSEGVYIFSSPNDWTYGGITASLQLNVRGEEYSFLDYYPARMYVVVEDAAGHSAIVYYDGDPQNLKGQNWFTWDIPLSQFTGVNLTQVKKFYLGFGTRGAATPTNSGLTPGIKGEAYFDEFRLYVPRCRPEFTLDGDFNGDCSVDPCDLEVLNRDWLMPDFNGTVLAWYKFDETSGTIAHDNNGMYDATVSTASAWDSSHKVNGKGSLNINGSVEVTVPSMLLKAFDKSQAITISTWLYGSNQPHTSAEYLFQGGDAGDYGVYANVPRPDWRVLWRCEDHDTDADWSAIYSAQLFWPTEADSSPTPISNWNGKWNHYAFTMNGKTGEMCIFFNGNCAIRKFNAFHKIGDWKKFVIGGRIEDAQYRYHGWLADFRMYDKALSQMEIQSILAGGAGIVPVRNFPILSPANPYDSEPAGSRGVNINDFAKLANNWLEVKLWP